MLLVGNCKNRSTLQCTRRAGNFNSRLGWRGLHRGIRWGSPLLLDRDNPNHSSWPRVGNFY